jgi:2-amino-4-hydroxy-6-hydroxymethyldihydropteridine diphosphokinase
VRYFIGLGANLGDRPALLRAATARLGELGTIRGRSHLYASEPVGPPQPAYLNAALCLDSALEPQALLNQALAIERSLGRDRRVEQRWGPRHIDIDLLLAGERGELVLNAERLTLPHPRLHERGFALVGVAELDPTLVHPLLHETVGALWRRAETAAPRAVSAPGEPL